MYVLTLLAVLLWWTMAMRPYSSGMAEFKRSLSTWSSNNECGTCNSQPTCAFLNGVCIEDPGSAVRYEKYDQSIDYEYCKNAVPSGSILLDSKDGQLVKFGHLSTASVENHSLWEWKLSFEGSQSVSIEIERSSNSYEDIYLYTYSEGKSKHYKNKDLSSCKDGRIKMDLESTSYMILRVKLLSKSSNYSIVVHQSPVESFFKTWMLFLIPVAFIMISCTIISSIIACWVKDKIRNKRELVRLRDHFLAWAKIKPMKISEIMKNMKNGQFEEYNSRYQETSWVVCLEDFQSEDLVHITNECSHTFHSSWIKEWFDNINPTKDMTCPHWNTVLSEKSSPSEDLDPNFKSLEDIEARLGQEASALPVIQDNVLNIHPDQRHLEHDN